MLDDRIKHLVEVVFDNNRWDMFDEWDVMKQLVTKGYKDFTYKEVENYLKHVNDNTLIAKYPNGKYEVNI